MLDEEERKILKAHADACNICRALYEKQAALEGIFAALPEEKYARPLSLALIREKEEYLKQKKKMRRALVVNIAVLESFFITFLAIFGKKLSAFIGEADHVINVVKGISPKAIVLFSLALAVLLSVPALFGKKHY